MLFLKFLLLSIGLVCCIVGLFLRKDAERKTDSNKWLTLGALLISANICYLWLKIPITIVMICVIILAVQTILYYERYLDNLEFYFSYIIVISMILYSSFAVRYFPSVTLDNGVIKMDGKFGGIFKVSDIKSVDTVSVIPRVVRRRSGSNPSASLAGNFDMVNERETAKLCLYRDNPPYIKIRMNNNSLLILNFKEPDKTVEFYNQLKKMR